MSESSSTPSQTSGSRLHDEERFRDYETQRSSGPLRETNARSASKGPDDHSLTDSDLTEGLDLGFDGAEDVLRAWRRGMRPDADLTVSEWADAHRWLSSRASAEPGRYRTARSPYLREIMDALSPSHPAQRISFMKAAQVGATEAGNNWIGFVIHHAPGPMLAVLPTVEMAKRTSRGRIDPLIEDSPALKERVSPARSRDAGNSMLSKEFPGGILVLTGANSATGLRSMPDGRKLKRAGTALDRGHGHIQGTSDQRLRLRRVGCLIASVAAHEPGFLAGVVPVGPPLRRSGGFRTDSSSCRVAPPDQEQFGDRTVPNGPRPQGRSLCLLVVSARASAAPLRGTSYEWVSFDKCAEAPSTPAVEHFSNTSPACGSFACCFQG